MKKTIVEILLVVFLVVLVAVIFYKVYPTQFTLYVSNQSSEMTPVPIKVYLDGVIVADKEFPYGTGRVYEKFSHSLSRGPHKLYVESIKGGAQLNEEFTVRGKHWAVIEYQRKPGRSTDGTATPAIFTFRVEDKPINF